MRNNTESPSIPSNPETIPINWPAAITLWATLAASIVLVPAYAIWNDYSTSAWITFISLALLNGIAITAGYHRLWAHRAYQANVVVRFVLLVFGTMAVQNSVFVWASGHRRHHRHVDSHDEDPYAATRGFWFSHMGWMVRCYPSGKDEFSNIPDLLLDRMLQFQHQYYALLALSINFGLPFLIGFLTNDLWGVVILGGLFRLVWCHHTTFFINSLAHIWGKRPYTDTNTARDNPILAFFTYGEGYHNYHHLFQYDYRNGIRWYQFDPTKWLICGLSFLGLTHDLKRIPEFKIEKARLDMQFKVAQNKLACSKLSKLETVTALKNRLAHEYDVFTAALQQWAKVKEEQIKATKHAFHNYDLLKNYKNQLAHIERQLKSQRKRVDQILEQLPDLLA